MAHEAVAELLYRGREALRGMAGGRMARAAVARGQQLLERPGGVGDVVVQARVIAAERVERVSESRVAFAKNRKIVKVFGLVMRAKIGDQALEPRCSERGERGRRQAAGAMIVGRCGKRCRFAPQRVVHLEPRRNRCGAMARPRLAGMSLEELVQLAGPAGASIEVGVHAVILTARGEGSGQKRSRSGEIEGGAICVC